MLSVACGDRCDAFATCAQDGTVRVWDLCDFGVVAEASERSQRSAGSARALYLCWLGDEAVVTGWSDCSVRYARRAPRGVWNGFISSRHVFSVSRQEKVLDV